MYNYSQKPKQYKVTIAAACGNPARSFLVWSRDESSAVNLTLEVLEPYLPPSLVSKIKVKQTKKIIK